MKSLITNDGSLRRGLLAVGIAMLMVAGASAQWQRGPGGPGGPGGQGGPGGPGGIPFRELNLTVDQHNQIRAIQEKSMEGFQATREQMKEIAEQRRAIVHADAFDAAAARELAAREAALQVEISVARMQTENAIYNVLTPEQKAKLAELEKNRPQGPPMGRRP